MRSETDSGAPRYGALADQRRVEHDVEARRDVSARAETERVMMAIRARVVAPRDRTTERARDQVRTPHLKQRDAELRADADVDRGEAFSFAVRVGRLRARRARRKRRQQKR